MIINTLGWSERLRTAWSDPNFVDQCSRMMLITFHPQSTLTLPLHVLTHDFRYLYWTIVNDSSNSLHQLNLQDPSMSSPLTVPSSSIGKRQATTTLSSLSLTPALALSPRTGRLWLCDANSGDILSCSPVNGSCTLEVEAAALGRNDIGINTDSLLIM